MAFIPDMLIDGDYPIVVFAKTGDIIQFLFENGKLTISSSNATIIHHGQPHATYFSKRLQLTKYCFFYARIRQNTTLTFV